MILVPLAISLAVAEPIAVPEVSSTAAVEAQAAPAQTGPVVPVPAPSLAATPPVDGEIVVTALDRSSPTDPVAPINVAVFDTLQVADRLVVEPVAKGYKAAFPKPVRDGVSNAINNLDEPIVFVNFMLQLKPGKALRTIARFTINTTLGVGGLFDMAKRKPFHLPRRSNGLADTLGYYGVKPGAYLFLPAIGSTTVRDVIGRVFDLSLLPTVLKSPFNRPEFSLTKGVLSAIDDRVQADTDGRAERMKSADPYVAVREYYLKTRASEILFLRQEKGAMPRLDEHGQRLIKKSVEGASSPQPTQP